MRVWNTVTSFVGVMLLALPAFSQANLQRAEQLYQRTQYQASLEVILADKEPDAAGFVLIGKNYYMLGDYKRAVEAFQKAVSIDPNNSEYYHQLGRAYGRRAETANPLAAPGLASKARQHFEKAVELDPKNQEALNDLFDYYLQAPGFLGGGMDKAAALAKRIGDINPAEYAFAQSQIAQKKKQYDEAEEQLRRAIALAPRQVGRVLDLAKYLARQGRIQESDAAFSQAEKMAPNSPKVWFTKAHVYIQQKRNLDEARELLQRYMHATLTPEDPSREEAQKLLKQAGA